LSLLFLASVIIVATIRGRKAAIIAASVGVPFYKLFLDFRTQEHTTALEDALNLFVFLILALITGSLAGRLHDEARKSHTQARRMELLYRTGRILGDEEHGDSFWHTFNDALARSTDSKAAVLDEHGALRLQHGPLAAEEVQEAVAIGAVLLRSEEPLTLPQRGWNAHLITLNNKASGVLVWECRPDDADIIGVVELLSELAAASLSRFHNRQEQVRIKAAEEAGRLRQTLLSSISHDFRSPLAAIIGSSTTLLEYGDQLEREVQKDLLSNICNEGERLNDFVSNLLSMTQLQAGVLHPRKEHFPVSSVLRRAVERLERHTGSPYQIQSNGDCSVAGDPMLLEQALYNILDNARKYGASSRGVEVSCHATNENCTIAIADHGPGLPEEDLPRMFEEFYFAKKRGRSQGTGLGLSIARGFVEAIGGRIAACSREDGAPGLTVKIILSDCSL
jgi:two-component system sensor histidine kinase KdpD